LFSPAILWSESDLAYRPACLPPALTPFRVLIHVKLYVSLIVDVIDQIAVAYPFEFFYADVTTGGGSVCGLLKVG